MSAGLNLAQQEAVNYLQGPCLVLAGAGSGKTVGSPGTELEFAL